jgi:hypothetical protein
LIKYIHEELEKLKIKVAEFKIKVKMSQQVEKKRKSGIF